MELRLQLCPDEGSSLSDPTRYCHLVGSLVYLTITRPDIAFDVHVLSQFVSAPATIHYAHLLRVLRYLRATMTRGLLYPCNNSLQLQAYSDATWVSDPVDRHFVTGYCLFLAFSLIAWKSKKQTGVSRSITEAELFTMTTTADGIVWLRWLLVDLNAAPSGPTTFYCDNTGAIQITLNPTKHSLSKHIDEEIKFLHTNVDLVVTLGGDGTVLWHGYLKCLAYRLKRISDTGNARKPVSKTPEIRKGIANPRIRDSLVYISRRGPSIAQDTFI
ncbi:putative NAD kinase 3 [Platanthera zijinensis]|uniref:NAD kinase 3 n=1 Tax=Platanthera zijinensis TaxID=2320716 RepID=A0AAP0FZS5_9ASPA